MGHESARGVATVKCILEASKAIDSSPTDLLLPEHILPWAIALADRHARWRDLIAYLLRRYRLRILALGSGTENLHFRYQPDGLRLHRISFLPYRGQHVELRMLSFATRISMCALVVMMLEWERDKERAGPEIHEVPIRFQARWEIASGLLTIFAKITPLETAQPP